jgi:hypothetical protein
MIAVAALYLAGFAVLSVIMPLQHGYTPEAPVAATVHVVTAADRQAKLDDQLAAEMTALVCTPPAMWQATHKAGQFPASMILKANGTFTLSTVAWTYPAPASTWVLALCEKGK